MSKERRSNEMQLGTFPFGEPLRVVAQKDRSPKKIFVLGVYASAVHARWIGPNGKTKVMAMAVASEPYIFWRGDGAAEIIGKIPVPPAAGQLVPAASRLNGPSGIALDEQFIEPLRLSRDDAWLSDLVPHGCGNPKQLKAIEERYLTTPRSWGLPKPSLPKVPRKLADDTRRAEILEELRQSRAKVLVLLGDQPIRWFVKHFDPRWKRLSDFGVTPRTYGRLHPARIDDLDIQLLPLAHPRQAAKLGSHSKRWFRLHQSWVRNGAAKLDL